MFDEMDAAFEVTGYDQLEVFAEEEDSIECSVSDDSVDTVETRSSHGFGVRALVDNKVGLAYTTDPGEVKEAAERAVKIARLSQFEMISFPVRTDFPDVAGVFHEDVATIDETALTRLTREAIDREARFSGGQTSRVVGASYIKNSAGVEVSQEETYLVSYFTANREGKSKYWFDASRSRFDISDTASNAVDLLGRSMGAKSIPESTETVVLTPYAQYQLFSGVLYPAFDADRVQRGKSPLADQKGGRVAAEGLTLRDDGRLDEGINTRSFDREGTPSQQTSLISDGVLDGFLYDVQRAEKAGVDSTGNAGGGYRNMPQIQPRNVVFEGETGSKDELDSAVIIQDLAGVHTANETSGDFSLNITTGFIYEDGEENAIDGGMFVGNVFELLKEFDFCYGDARMVDSLTSRPAVFRDQDVVQ